ncbi:MAG: TRAP transporter substrate-binding protein [Devosiaceae bacterium]|nr:TRAP transporter substrate-binding protein [Devosiaceae bacterium]
MNRNIKSLIGAAVMATVLAASSAAYAETTLTMATGDTIGSLRNQLGNRVRDNLAEADGDVQIKHIEGPVLGNAAQILEQVIDGSIDIVGTDFAWLTPYNDFLKTTSFAFIFRDSEHIESVLESDFMQDVIDEVAAEHGLRILGLKNLPARSFFARNELDSAADFDGLKVRSPQLNVWIESYKALGANPTPVNWNEVFVALKTGLVEAAHGLPADVIANKWHLAAPNIIALDDMYAFHVWVINEAKWQSLSEDKQAQLKAVLDESMEWLGDQSDEIDINSIVTMIEEGGGVYISRNEAKREIIASRVGADRVREFPQADFLQLRAGALEAARNLEGSKDWWGVGLVDLIDAIE